MRLLLVLVMLSPRHGPHAAYARHARPRTPGRPWWWCAQAPRRRARRRCCLQARGTPSSPAAMLGATVQQQRLMPPAISAAAAFVNTTPAATEVTCAQGARNAPQDSCVASAFHTGRFEARTTRTCGRQPRTADFVTAPIDGPHWRPAPFCWRQRTHTVTARLWRPHGGCGHQPAMQGTDVERDGGGQVNACINRWRDA
jgi:hypothetical protein